MAAPTFFEERSIAVERSCPDEEGRTLAQAVVNTIREPLIVLDKNLRVVTANRAFYLTFMMSRHEVQGQPIHVLSDGQWDIPELRSLLRKTATQRAVKRTIVVDPGDRWQLRQLRCIRQHFRKRYHCARKPCEENLIHSAVQSAVDWGG